MERKYNKKPITGEKKFSEPGNREKNERRENRGKFDKKYGGEASEVTDEIIFGRNSVIEALKSGTPINKLLYQEGEKSGSINSIIAMAKEKGIVYTEVRKEKLDELTGGGNHQGALVYVAPTEYADVDDIFKVAEEKNEAPFIIILDEIQDAGNLGAIIRTADSVGAHGVIISKRRAAPLTAAVAKASSGAISYVKVARVPNIPQLLDELKEKGLWIAGTDLTGETKFYEADLKGPLGIVIGSEGNGMGRLVREKCDMVLTIPMAGSVSSLNASVAAGVVLYEAFKQRNV